MEIKILNRTYKMTEFDEKWEIDDKKEKLVVYGHTDHIDQTIMIYSKLGKDTKPHTIAHEIMHCIFSQMGFYKANDNEELIDAIATGIVALLRDNPDIVSVLTTGQQKP